MCKFTSSLAVLVSFAFTTPILADTCNLEAQLAAKGKSLTTTIGVPKRDRDFIEQLGIELRNGLFGAKYVETNDLLVALALKGCDATLIDWVVTRTRKAPSSSGSGGTGGGDDSICATFPELCDGSGVGVE